MLTWKSIRTWWNVYSNHKNHSYSKEADEFFKFLMKNDARVVTFDYYNIYLELEGRVYWVWYRNQYYASFLDAWFIPRSEEGSYNLNDAQLVYRRERPSRRVEYKFMRYLQEHPSTKTATLATHLIGDLHYSDRELKEIQEQLTELGFRVTIDDLRVTREDINNL